MARPSQKIGKCFKTSCYVSHFIEANPAEAQSVQLSDTQNSVKDRHKERVLHPREAGSEAHPRRVAVPFNEDLTLDVELDILATSRYNLQQLIQLVRAYFPEVI